MPWMETSPMEERVRFIDDLSSYLYTMTELCELYGISRKTGYKWATRYGQEKVMGLQDRSRRPKRSPNKTDQRCVEALLEERRAHPLWGPRKLLARLGRRHPDWPWPAVSTAAATLKRHGRVKPRRRSRRRPDPTRPRVETTAPNQVWAADFKGQFRLGNGQMCFPLTVSDHYSRYLIGCRGGLVTTHDTTRQAFEEIFRRIGMPEAILTDNGPPFAGYLAPRRLSRLAIWWIRLGIEPILTQPAHPEQNGSHERMHWTLKAATARPPARDMPSQQARFDDFQKEYNEERPHEGIGQRMPAELYRPSLRPYPAELPPPRYPGHFELRRALGKGAVQFKGKSLFISEVVQGETVGLEEIDDGIWSIYFGPVLLGRYDERDDNPEFL